MITMDTFYGNLWFMFFIKPFYLHYSLQISGTFSICMSILFWTILFICILFIVKNILKSMGKHVFYYMNDKVVNLEICYCNRTLNAIKLYWWLSQSYITGLSQRENIWNA